MSNNLYIRQEPLVTGPVEVSTDNTSWSTISWPYTVTNPTPPTILKVLFTTDITLTANDQFFVCGSEYIQFGSESLNPDGTRPTITITSGANSYPGLIQNGTLSINGKDNISVYNLIVDGSGATLSNFGGWIGQSDFSNIANNNYIIGCSSKGDITPQCGGIVGADSGLNGNLTIIGCDSSGDIFNNGGGIAGSKSLIRIYQCFSKGNIIGSNAGGIVGPISQNMTISNCYSIGNILGSGAGGISGSNAINIQVSKSYSRGTITGPDAGGITGQEPINCTATNCYSSGNIAGSSAGGIFGAYGFGNTQTNCYAANGNWTDSAATFALQNIGWGSGKVWGSLSTDTPYVLVGFGASPYTLNNIDPTTQTLVQTFSQTVQVGNATSGALAAGYKTFAIQAGGDPTITIDNTGVITTTSETPLGTYTLSIYGVDDYTTTTYILTVTEAPPQPTPTGGAGVTIPPCCEANTCNKNPQISSYSSETIALNRAGKAINTSVTNFYNDVAAGLRPSRYKPIFKSYYDYMQFLQGKSR